MADVPRPAPPRTVAERVRDQIEFFGVARLVSVTVAVVAVVGGAWFLVADAGPPPESSLPRAVPTPTSEPPEPVSPTSADGPDLGSVTVEAEEANSTAASVDPEPDVVVVHVAGAVLSPGVHELRPGDRIADAVARAGGPSPGADLDALNLAAPLTDGARIVVPTEGEEAVVEIPAGSSPVDASASSDIEVRPIDVNRAGVDELDALPGVGPATAQAIVTERERNGPFSSVDDLERVPGIGPAKLDAIRDQVTT